MANLLAKRKGRRASALRELPGALADTAIRIKLPSPAQRAFAAVYPSKARPAFWWEAHRAGDDYGVPAEPRWRAVDWSRHRHTARIAGRDMVYVDIGEGEGPPVVFIHGLGGNWQNWLENLPRVAQERRAIAVDLPGFGESDMPADKITVSGYGRWVEELLDRLEIDRAVIVGNSMGGFIGAEIAISHSHRVERLVLAAAAGISSSNAKKMPALTFARISTAFGTFTAARSRDVALRLRLRHLVLSSVIRHPTRLRTDILLEVMQGSGAPGFMSAADALLSYDVRDRLPEIECPTLLVWGAEDILVPVQDADEFERLLTDSRKVVFDETGHAPMLERPQQFNDSLMQFLADEGLPGVTTRQEPEERRRDAEERASARGAARPPS